MFKSIIQRLQERLIPSRKSNDPLPNPLGLTDDQIRYLSELVGTQSWTTYLQTLDKVIKLHSETLLTSRDAAVLHETRGFVLGLQQAGTLVDEILTKTQEVREYNVRLDSADKFANDIRTISLYGTSAWPGPGAK